MYEDLRNDVKWEQDRPTGLIFHVASVDSAGNMHVADVWESQQHLDEFLNKRLIPVMKKRNIPPPKTDVFQVHNINAYAGADKYKLK